MSEVAHEDYVRGCAWRLCQRMHMKIMSEVAHEDYVRGCTWRLCQRMHMKIMSEVAHEDYVRGCTWQLRMVKKKPFLTKGQEFHPVSSLYLSRVSSNPIESVVTIFSYKIAERDDKGQLPSPQHILCEPFDIYQWKHANYRHPFTARWSIFVNIAKFV